MYELRILVFVVYLAGLFWKQKYNLFPTISKKQESGLSDTEQ